MNIKTIFKKRNSSSNKEIRECKADHADEWQRLKEKFPVGHKFEFLGVEMVVCENNPCRWDLQHGLVYDYHVYIMTDIDVFYVSDHGIKDFIFTHQNIELLKQCTS